MVHISEFQPYFYCTYPLQKYMLYVLYVFLSDPPFHLGPSMTIHQEAYDRWLQQTGHQAADDITVLVVDLTAREAKEPCGQTLAETQLVEYGCFQK